MHINTKTKHLSLAWVVPDQYMLAMSIKITVYLNLSSYNISHISIDNWIPPEQLIQVDDNEATIPAIPLSPMQVLPHKQWYEYAALAVQTYNSALNRVHWKLDMVATPLEIEKSERFRS